MTDRRTYLNSLPVVEQQLFAERCGTSIGYLRKAISAGQKLGADLAVNIERESGGAVRVESVRADIDWSFIRNTSIPASQSAA